MIAISASYFFALLLRFDFQYSQIEAGYLSSFFRFLPIYLVFCLVLFQLLHLYRSLWRFASISELCRIAVASAISSFFHMCAITLLFTRMPVSYHIIGTLLQFFFVTAVRFSYRFVLLLYGQTGARRRGEQEAETAAPAPNIMLIGAGNAGQMILRDIHAASEIKGRVACIIDDNPNKWGRYMEGVPIIGGRGDIPQAVEKYKISRIYIAIPSASMQDRKEILDICGETGCEIKNLPGMFQLVQGSLKVSQMQDVSVEDLLGREPVKANLQEVFAFIHGKTVLVTGGGGSIGSELCRQIA